MSASLAKDLPSTVSAAIDDLTEVENSPDFSDQDCFRQLGPFGVFKASAQVPREEEGSLTESMPYPSQYLTIGNVDFYTSPCFTTSHLDPGSSDPTLGMLTAEAEAHEDLDVFLTRSLDTMQWGDLFQWNADYFTTTDIRPGSSIPNFTDQTSIHDDVGIMSIATVDTACDDFQWPEIDLSSEAPLLLKHFNNEVITQMGSLPINVKSAWRTLNFPSAVFTLSQLTILGLELSTIKRANLANFFALIAVSALHLSLRSDTQTNTPDTSDKSRHWRSLSTRTYKAAKDLLRASFATECASQGKAKYKDQLMAVGAVLATAVCRLVIWSCSLANVWNSWYLVMSRTYEDTLPRWSA
jgi:arginine metabolism regulation protein II